MDTFETPSFKNGPALFKHSRNDNNMDSFTKTLNEKKAMRHQLLPLNGGSAQRKNIEF